MLSFKLYRHKKNLSHIISLVTLLSYASNSYATDNSTSIPQAPEKIDTEKPSELSIPVVSAKNDMVTTSKTNDPEIATDTKPSIFSFNGFGTLSLVHSSEKNADFTPSNLYKPNGAGYTHNWSGDVDTLLAGQVNAAITPKLSAVLQVITEQHHDNSYQPKVEWANVKYQVSSNLYVRLGRSIMPAAFIFSDSKKVGYSYPWVRPPLDVYGLIPLTICDGIDAGYTFTIGDVVNSLHAHIAQTDLDFVGLGLSKTRNQWGASISSDYGPWTTNFSYQQASVTVPFPNTFFDLFKQFGPKGIEIANKYDFNNKLFTFIGAGISYDQLNWFAMSEFGHLDTHSALGRRNAWYVSSGYRFGKFTPYATYSRVRTNFTSDSGLDVSSVPPAAAGFAAGLNAGLNGILSSNPIQSTISIGTKWDFKKNMDLKIQFDRGRIGAGSSVGLANVQPTFQPGGYLNLVSIALDFVF